MHAVIDFTGEAKEVCAFTEINLRIFIFDDSKNLVSKLPYNEFNMNKVKGMDIPIVEKFDQSSCEPTREPLLLSRLRVR